MGLTGAGVQSMKWVQYLGVIGAAIVVIWALADFSYIGGPGFGIGFWLYNEYLWSLLILGAVVGAIYWVSKSA